MPALPAPSPPLPELPGGRLSLAQGLHARLMPDYNRKATLYWWLMLLGGLAMGHSLLQLAGLPALALLQLAGGPARR